MANFSSDFNNYFTGDNNFTATSNSQFTAPTDAQVQSAAQTLGQDQVFGEGVNLTQDQIKKYAKTGINPVTGAKATGKDLSALKTLAAASPQQFSDVASDNGDGGASGTIGDWASSTYGKNGLAGQSSHQVQTAYGTHTDGGSYKAPPTDAQVQSAAQTLGQDQVFGEGVNLTQDQIKKYAKTGINPVTGAKATGKDLSALKTLAAASPQQFSDIASDNYDGGKSDTIGDWASSTYGQNGLAGQSSHQVQTTYGTHTDGGTDSSTTTGNFDYSEFLTEIESWQGNGSAIADAVQSYLGLNQTNSSQGEIL